VQPDVDLEGTDAAGMDNVPSADFALQKSYAVWAMVKQQKHQIDMSETYQVANKEVAKFKTVGEFWQVQSHLRRPSVMPIGTFLHFVSLLISETRHINLLIVCRGNQTLVGG